MLVEPLPRRPARPHAPVVVHRSHQALHRRDEDAEARSLVGWARFVDPGAEASPAQVAYAADALVDASGDDPEIMHRAWLLALGHLGRGESTRSATELLRVAAERAAQGMGRPPSGSRGPSPRSSASTPSR